MRVLIRSLLIALTLVASSSWLGAQVQRLALLLPTSERPHNVTAPIPESARYLRMDAAAFDALAPIATENARIENLQLPDGTRYSLTLERFDVLSPTGVVVEGSRSGDRPVTMEKHLIFSGSVDGVAGSHVYLAFFRSFAFGFIELPQLGTTMPRRIMIAPDNLDNPTPTMIMYDERDVAPPDRAPYLCGAAEAFDQRQKEIEELRDDLFGNGKRQPAPRLQNAQILAAQIGVECEYSFFSAHGKNLSRAANYAVVLMGAVSSVYQRDVRVALQVPYLRVWTTATNPYPGPSDGDLLGQIRNFWLTNMTDVSRTSAIILTSYRGGVAWVGTMCGDYGFAQAGPGGNFNFPTSGYVWDIDVVAHELGHNFGSPHTHSCFWNPAVDSCWGAEGGCFTGTYPHPGTIMSYCHLTVGTVATFHPRVATLIRAACEKYGCMSPVPSPAPNDIAAVQIINPALGSTMKRAATFTPTAMIRNIGTSTQTGVKIRYTIRNPAGAVAYADSTVVASVASGANATASFRSIALQDTGVYMASITAVIPSDTALGNNALARQFEVVTAQPNTALKLLTQNGGETYFTDGMADIRWEQTAVADLTIELSPDNGATWRTVQWSQRGDSGHYMWKVPPVPTREALIRITNTADARIWDQSDRPFVIALDKDVQALEFVQPRFNDTIASPFTPRVAIRHNGTLPLTNVPVQLKMTWRPGDLGVYDTTIVIPALAGGEVRTVDFPPTGMLPQGNLIMVMRTKLPDDRNISNDSLARTAEVTAGLSPPTAVFATGLDGAVALTWPASGTTGITGYRLYRGKDPESLALIATLRPTVLAYVDDPLKNDSLYYYAVAAVRGNEQSAFSHTAVGDPVHQIAGDTLRVPTPLHPARDASELPLPLQLVWRSVRGAELYQVQIAADRACTDVIANYITGTAEPLTPDVVGFKGAYHWRVRSFNNSFTGPWSQIWSFGTGQNCAASALRFPGGTSAVQDTTFIWNGGPVTVEFWNYVASNELGQSSAFGVGPRDDGGNRFHAHVPWEDQNVYWDYGNIGIKGGRLVANYGAYLNKWTHVAFVSNAKDYRAIYFNGELAAVATDTAAVPTALQGLRIGSAAGGTFPDRATIDEFRIWNRARTQDEIRHAMSRSIDVESGLAARWRFDEGSGTLANGLNPPAAGLLGQATWVASGALISCVRGNDLNAPTAMTPQGNAAVPPLENALFTWTAVPDADAYQLEIAQKNDFVEKTASVGNIGTTAYVHASLTPNTTYYWRVRGVGTNGPGLWSQPAQFTTNKPCADSVLVLDGVANAVEIPSFVWKSRAVTVECWLRVDSADVRNSWLFYTADADSADRLSAHVPWSDKVLRFDYGRYGAGGRVQTDFAPYIGKWTHVALVSNGRDFKGIYLNGRLVSSAGIARRPLWPRKGLVIGGGRNTPFFKGKLTEFRVWNTARTEAAIRENMYRRIGGPRSGLVGCWPLDGSADSVARDVSGFGNDGVIRNRPTWENLTPLGPGGAAIVGPDRVVYGSDGEMYKAADSTLSDYRWTVIGGTITAGQGTARIGVQWGEDGNDGIVALTATTKSGCEVTTALAVAITDGSGVPVAGAAASLAMEILPNPTKDEATVTFTMPSPAAAMLEVFSSTGERVRTVDAGRLAAGEHHVNISVRDLPSGTYFCRLRAGDRVGRVTLQVVR